MKKVTNWFDSLIWPLSMCWESHLYVVCYINFGSLLNCPLRKGWKSCMDKLDLFIVQYPQKNANLAWINFFNFFLTFFYSMVKIESFFFKLSISTVYYYCIRCNILGIAPNLNPCGLGFYLPYCIVWFISNHICQVAMQLSR